MIAVENVSKSFTLHNQGAAVISVMEGASFNVAPGECVGLIGASGMGKSTLMRMLYGNFFAAPGAIVIDGVNVAQARAKALLTRLTIPQVLWHLSPATFSGVEQQRVNIARGFAHLYPALLLDEPTASLDPTNRDIVLSLIEEAKAGGAAIVDIFHDAAARARLCDREIDVTQFAPGQRGGMT